VWFHFNHGSGGFLPKRAVGFWNRTTAIHAQNCGLPSVLRIDPRLFAKPLPFSAERGMIKLCRDEKAVRNLFCRAKPREDADHGGEL